MLLKMWNPAEIGRRLPSETGNRRLGIWAFLDPDCDFDWNDWLAGLDLGFRDPVKECDQAAPDNFSRMN
jgi:hypothetical protein